MLTYKIHLIRHGLTQANYDGRYIGTTDEPLCDSGREQLVKLFRAGGYPEVERVYTSPLLRACESASILFPKQTAIVKNDLRELDFGAFENRTAAELEHDEAFCAWRAAKPDTRTPGGESSADLLYRACRALQSIFFSMSENNIRSVAVLTHGGLIMSLLSAMGLPMRPLSYWSCQPGEGFTIAFSAQMWMRDNKFEICGVVPNGQDE